MNLYKVYIVDRKKGVLLAEHTLVGKDTGDAALELELTEGMKALKGKDELEIVWQTVGGFEKKTVKSVRME